MRRIGIVLISTMFFTACSPDQAVKNYYRASLNGEYAHAGRYVVSSQREAYAMLDKQQTPEDRKALRRRKVHVRDVSVERTNDSAAVATCMLLVKERKQPEDTAYRVVLLKKEGRRWKVNNGLLPVR